jgi:hypothetical protein
MTDLERQDDAHHRERERARTDQPCVTDCQSIDQPQQYADGTQHRSRKRYRLGFLVTDDFQRLRHPAQRRQSGASRPDRVDEQ